MRFVVVGGVGFFLTPKLGKDKSCLFHLSKWLTRFKIDVGTQGGDNII